MEHSMPSALVAMQSADSQSAPDVHAEPRPIGEYGARMHSWLKHSCIAAQSESALQVISDGTFASRNAFSASTRVSAPNDVQLGSPNEVTPTSTVSPPICANDGPPESPEHLPV